MNNQNINEENINEENINNQSEEELSYEEEQLQLLLMKECHNIKLNNERNLKHQQDLEYQQSLENDLNKNNLEFEEISLQEMRNIRLKRFQQ